MRPLTALRTYLIVAGGLCGLAASATAAETRYFSIGTGSTAGTYFPIGSLIAAAISRPTNSSPCDEGGGGGVDGLIATAVTSRGSFDNIEGIAEQRFNSGLAQADIAAWAYGGEGIFKGRDAYPDLRAIANLYPEHVHLVVRKDLGITSVADLKGKRIAVDREGSGTRINALLILNGFGIGRSDFQVVSAAPEAAITGLLDDQVDAAFFVVGYPSSAVLELTETSRFALLPIEGAAAEKLMAANRFFAAGRIPAATYQTLADVPTLTVGAQWVTTADMPEQLVYDITEALWREENRALLTSGHAKGSSLSLETATDGVTIPFHPGAMRYYTEKGILK